MRVSRHSCRESVSLCHNYSTTTCFILLKVETVIKLPYYHHHHCWQNRYLHFKLMWVVYITYALCLFSPCRTRCLLLCQMNYLHTAQTALASLKNVFPGKFQFSSCRTENKLAIVFTMRAVSVPYKIWAWLFWANYFCTMKNDYNYGVGRAWENRKDITWSLLFFHYWPNYMVMYWEEKVCICILLVNISCHIFTAISHSSTI